MSDITTMHKLMNKGAMVDAKPVDGCSALHDAAKVNKLDIMRILLAAGAKVDNKRWGETPLTAAVSKGHTDAVKVILDSAGDDFEKRKYWISQALAFVRKGAMPKGNQERMRIYLESLQ